MSHLLATRYTVKEDFGIAKTMEKLEGLAKKVKDDRALVESKEKGKKMKMQKILKPLKLDLVMKKMNIKMKSEMPKPKLEEKCLKDLCKDSIKVKKKKK